MSSAWTTPVNHFFSQLVYLNVPPVLRENPVCTVGELADYYLHTDAGKQQLLDRFKNIQKEYEQWLLFLQYKAPAFKDWKITNILNDNLPNQTGLYCCTFVGPKGERVVAFRGSELLGNRYFRNDYANDLALSYMLVTPQQQKLEEYWSQLNPEDLQGGFSVTGHSLGGNLALYAAIKAPPSIRPWLGACFSFNAPGFNGEFIKQNKEAIAALKGQIALYQNQFDPVSSMLYNPVEPIIAASRFNPHAMESPSIEEIFYPHSNFMFETDPQGWILPAAEKEKCRFCRMVHLITDMVLLLPKEVRKDISDVLLDVIYHTPSKGDICRRVLDGIGKYIGTLSPFVKLGTVGLEAVHSAANLMQGTETIAHRYQSIIQDGKPQIFAAAQTLLILLESLSSFL